MGPTTILFLKQNKILFPLVIANENCILHRFEYITIPYHSFMTTVSQIENCDFWGETFKGFEVQ
jgi:hypothetical protein